MENKKIGLITWHYYDNVGSNLQAYAIYKTISDNGGDCKFINYRKKEFDDNIVKKYIKIFCSFLNKIGIIDDLSNYSFKSRQFQKKYFKMTPKCNNYNIKKYSDKFDIFICGSDQIWAPSVFDENYLLSFTCSKNKFSYAASLGLNNIPLKLQYKYKKLLLDFKKISVREKKGYDLLKKIGINSKVVLDPTFLLEKKQWMDISNKKIIKDNDKYIFCYLIGKNDKQLEFIKKYSDIIKTRLIIYSPVNDISDYNFKNVLKKLGPEEFISYIANAEHIFTDSYHGCIFSIIFEKKFNVFLRFNDENDINSQNSRIYNLLDLLSIEKFLIKDYDDINIDENYNYQEIMLKLEKYKKESFEFLNSILEVCNE